MNKINKNIEDIFKESFDGFKVNPSQNLWNGLRGKLWWKEFLQFSTGSINAYYVGAIVFGTIATFSTVKFINNNESKVDENKVITEVQNPTETISENKNYILTQPGQEIDKSNDNNFKNKLENKNLQGQNNLSQANLELDQDNINSENSTSKKVVSGKVSKNNEKGNKLNQSTHNLPVADFKPSTLSGCQGLTIKFINTSDKSVWQKWDFGNNQYSYEKNPSFTYNMAGEYEVKLKIKGIDGNYYSSIRKIEIYENPKAMFEIDKFNSDLNNKTIYFNNNSTNNILNKWEFGDNQVSEEVNPVHLYDVDDIFLVKLKVQSSKGCTDSVTIRNNFLKANYYIAFPSAFTPSINGPRRGFYTPGGNTDEIFYPDFKGVADYKLQIFSRTGILMFESTDINYGWNGYYKNIIVDMGVYIWEVTGKYYDGEGFAKNGTVTVIHKN